MSGKQDKKGKSYAKKEEYYHQKDGYDHHYQIQGSPDQSDPEPYPGKDFPSENLRIALNPFQLDPSKDNGKYRHHQGHEEETYQGKDQGKNCHGLFFTLAHTRMNRFLDI
jgi:hypothetical protein